MFPDPFNLRISIGANNIIAIVKSPTPTSQCGAYFLERKLLNRQIILLLKNKNKAIKKTAEIRNIWIGLKDKALFIIISAPPKAEIDLGQCLASAGIQKNRERKIPLIIAKRTAREFLRCVRI